jgi:hypothetical protein
VALLSAGRAGADATAFATGAAGTETAAVATTAGSGSSLSESGDMFCAHAPETPTAVSNAGLKNRMPFRKILCTFIFYLLRKNLTA